jgi:hypothetical protein
MFIPQSIAVDSCSILVLTCWNLQIYIGDTTRLQTKHELQREALNVHHPPVANVPQLSMSHRIYRMPSMYYNHAVD